MNPDPDRAAPSTTDPAQRTERAMAVLLPVAGWAVYAPLGTKYMTWALATALALRLLQQRRAWSDFRQQAGLHWLLAWGAWMLLSAAWSKAPGRDIVSHGWMVAITPSALLMAVAVPPELARRALQHFVAASALLGLLLLAHAEGVLPDSVFWSSSIQAEGNQRIMTSILLALGAALAGCLAHRAPSGRWRWVWMAAAGACVVGLASQDRRTGMLLLPLLMLAGALAAARTPRLKLMLVVLVVGAAAGVWTASDTVRARFAEGRSELQAYEPQGNAVTSWGQRARLLQLTAQMVEERPLVGHGLGSWRMLWRQRTEPGTLLADNSTPHNDYLLAATQAGMPAALLLLAWLLAMVAVALRARRFGTPALMVWLSVLLCGLASAVLRDAKLALPLLLLAGLATAVARQGLAMRSTHVTKP